MPRTPAQSKDAASALALVESLQKRFVHGLQSVAAAFGESRPFAQVEWLRDEGRHGGGVRYVHGDSEVFNRASVNVSQVHYDDLPDRRLSSATALSTIIHPGNPNAPSVHMHFSWTQPRQGKGYWRIMADLNPSIEHPEAKAAFDEGLRRCAGEHLEYGREQGERYFFIPVLGRHRGVSHFYLEGYRTDDPEADLAHTRSVAETMMDTYCALLRDALDARPDVSEQDRARQLAYHTLYLFQVLTLDRGTTSGLLVHDQNDLGTMGSLPSHVDRGLLASWIDDMPEPQDELLQRIVRALPEQQPAPVTDEAKQAFAHAIRKHYRLHPEGLDLQAAGDVVPPTVANHGGR